MKLYLTFSGEGPTDQRFIQIIVERLIKDFLIEKSIEAEFSWIIVAKKGTSYENILKACEDAQNYHLVLFHRDSGNTTWEIAYDNHFSSAVKVIQNDSRGLYNKNLIPVIPITEIEAWMLCSKDLLKAKIETELNFNDLLLNYKITSIESINDPKDTIERAIAKHNQTLTPKQRKYAVKLSDLYDSIAAEVSFADLEKLSAFKKFKESLNQVLINIVA